MRLSFGTAFDGQYEKLKIMLAALAVIVLRSPRLLFSGRVFAEEGTVYLKDAWDSPVLRALGATHQGYYSLLDNVAAVVGARVLPVSWASCWFTFVALLVFLLLIYLVICCEVFRSTQTRVVAALLCLVSPSLEVWLTLEDAQFCLAACVAMVLLSEAGQHRLTRYGALMLGGLSGPLSCALAPFAVVRAWRHRNVDAVTQAVALCGCAVVEAGCVLRALQTGTRALAPGEKLAWLGPMFDLKILSVTFGTRLSFFALVHLLLRHQGAVVIGLMWVIALTGLMALVQIARIGGAKAAWTLSMAGWLFLFAYAGIGHPISILIGGASRYFYATDLLVWLMVLIACQASVAGSRTRGWMRGLVVFLVCAGVLDSAGYWSKNQAVAAPWRAQVAAWEIDPSTRIVISPSTWQDRLELRRRSK